MLVIIIIMKWLFICDTGLYWLDTNGGAPNDKFQANCKFVQGGLTCLNATAAAAVSQTHIFIFYLTL